MASKPTMQALIYEAFGEPPHVADVPRVRAGADDVVVRVLASGICRSDWHGWLGHDADIVRLPHVPGHEFAGIVSEVGSHVRRWQVGDRVTAPFCCGCGVCQQCLSGNGHICLDDSQPGFTHWGSLAEFVVVKRADFNLVALPPELDAGTAATLGCRFGTAFHAVVDQAAVRPGQSMAVIGCGGLGLSAVMIAIAAGAYVVAVDIQPDKLAFARKLGAHQTVLANSDVVATVRELTYGGVDVALDALGSSATCQQGLRMLRPQGCLVQVGLLTGPDRTTSLELGGLIGQELRILGSHGLPPHRYGPLLRLVTDGVLAPQTLISHRMALADSPQVFLAMERFASLGFSVVEFPEAGCGQMERE